MKDEDSGAISEILSRRLHIEDITEETNDTTLHVSTVTYLLEHVVPILWTIDDSSDNSAVKQALVDFQDELQRRPDGIW